MFFPDVWLTGIFNPSGLFVNRTSKIQSLK